MDPVEALKTFVRRVMASVLYLGQYDATVERQHADGSLDLMPDDVRVRGQGLSQVPVRHGLPGVDVRVVTGSRVLLGFRNGDRKKPYASLWDAGSIESIAFDGGTAPIARQGDMVATTWPAISVTGTVTAGAFTGVAVIGTQSPGVIQSGAQRVRA